jgi:hypothetical protein
MGESAACRYRLARGGLVNAPGELVESSRWKTDQSQRAAHVGTNQSHTTMAGGALGLWLLVADRYFLPERSHIGGRHEGRVCVWRCGAGSCMFAQDVFAQRSGARGLPEGDYRAAVGPGYAAHPRLRVVIRRGMRWAGQPSLIFRPCQLGPHHSCLQVMRG